MFVILVKCNLGYTALLIVTKVSINKYAVIYMFSLSYLILLNALKIVEYSSSELIYHLSNNFSGRIAFITFKKSKNLIYVQKQQFCI